MVSIHDTFDYGYDPSITEEAPLVRPTRPAVLPVSATVDPEWLPPVGKQTTPSCFVWSSTYGLATFAAAQVGNYQPSDATRQASPLYTYIKILEERSIAANDCTGGQITSCFSFLQANDGTPSMAFAPNQDGCATTWNAYGGETLPPDSRFAVSDWAYIEVKKPTLAEGLDAVRTQIAAGIPLAYGTYLYQNFIDYDGSVCPFVGQGDFITNKKTGALAGHCMVVIGYDDQKGAVLIQNSWGTEWGIPWRGSGGYVWMAYETFQASAQGQAFFLT